MLPLADLEDPFDLLVSILGDIITLTKSLKFLVCQHVYHIHVRISVKNESNTYTNIISKVNIILELKGVNEVNLMNPTITGLFFTRRNDHTLSRFTCRNAL